MSATSEQPAGSDGYARFASSVLFPIHERIKRHDSLALRRELERTQWWTPEAIEDLQAARLREMLLSVSTHVPYYRDLFARLRFDPMALTGLSDLRALPLLRKEDIRANADSLKADDAGALARFNTGGSSGEPLVFFLGLRVSYDVAAKWRATRWWGVDIGDREIVVWGSPIELGAQDRVRLLRDRMLRTRLLPAFEMSEAKLDAFVQVIRSMRPRMLFGYPSALALIASHAAARGVRLDDLGIRVAFVTAERLYDEQREAIGRGFGCRVANGYGGRDAGFVAHECPAGGLHITAEQIIVETVDRDGNPTPDGVPGEIVVTHLGTPDFPFIRYCTGDVGVLDDRVCACGRGLPMLKEIQGRTTDFVIAADGTVMHGLALIYVLRDLRELRQFKIVQESREHTRVLVVPSQGYSPDISAKIAAEFRRRLGHSVRVDVETVAEIAPERSGKHRYVVSRVATGPAPDRRTESESAD